MNIVHPENMEPHQKLAAAVILAAIWDAQNGIQKAEMWLQGDEASFHFWCSVYGIEVGFARKCLKVAMKEACVSNKRRKELIMQALVEHPELNNRQIAHRLRCYPESVKRIRKLLPQGGGPLEERQIPSLTLTPP